MSEGALRVLCLTSWYPPHHFGGYELSCRDVMGRLAERGHHVEVLTSDHRHDDVADDDPAPVARIHRRVKLYFRDGELWSPSARVRLGVERHNQRALADALAECQPDVVSVWHVGAMSLNLLRTLRTRGVPLVFAISDDWTIYAPDLDPWTRATRRLRWLTPVVEALTGVGAGIPELDDAGAACFISEVTRQRSQQKSPWQFATNGLVYSGIDWDLFSLNGAPTPDRVDKPGRIRLLYVGRIDARKGIRTLVKAIALLPDAELVIDGRASDAAQAQLLEWVEEAGVAGRVTMCCSPREDLPRQYQSADICVFPSEWEEPFGLVPLEAMASGTPVVATGVGGSGEFLIDGENYVRFSAGDERSLAKAVLRVMGEPDLRDHLIPRGVQTAKHFDAEHLTTAFEAWHRAAADGFRDGIPPDRPLPDLT